MSLSFPLAVILFLTVLSPLVQPHYLEPTRSVQLNARDEIARTSGDCFPALGFTMPPHVPTTLDGWWCPYDVEYAFVGFSYEVTECMSEGIIICLKQHLSFMSRSEPFAAA